MTIGTQEWAGLTLASGRYKVTAKLGEGGMGFVYRALDQNIDAEVVIKVPRQAMMEDPEFAGRFTHEIRSLVRLSHPHIVKVTDVGNYDGIPFAVMQYLAGGSLEDQRPIGPDGQLLPCEPRNVSRWVIAVADALDYIHRQGYVHRDVKPGNILFDTHGHAFLSDFGVAKVVASSRNAAPARAAMTGAGLVLGTPEYMAPELIMGDALDGRADQYALAITVYELLCGRRPFEDETKTKVMVLHTSKAPPPLTAWCQSLPVSLSQVVLKGLAKEPSQRYATCTELARAVAAAAENATLQSERIRLKCPSCGKTGSTPVSDLARLKAAGGRATCPACKSPIDIGSAVQVAPGPTSGGTMNFSISSNTQQYPPAAGQSPAGGGGTTIPLAAVDRQAPPPLPGKNIAPPRGGSGTIIERTLPAPGESSVPPRGGSGTLIERTLPVPGQISVPPRGGSGTLIERTLPLAGESSVPPRRGSGTLIERTLPRPDDAAAGTIFKSVAGSTPQAPTDPPGKIRAPGSDQTRLWIAIGSAAAAGLLATVGTALFLSTSRKNSDSPSSAPAAASQPAESIKPENTHQESAPPPPTTIAALTESPPAKKLASGAPPKKNARRRAQPKQASTEPNPATPEVDSNVEPDPPPPAEPTPLAKAKRAHPPAPKGVFAAQNFDAARLPRRPRQLEEPLMKTLEKSRSYREEVVVPGGMYCLTRSRADHRSGPRKFIVTECELKEQGPRKTLHLVSTASKELEFEPHLASQLDSEWSAIERRMAILTLWFTSSGDYGVVRAEILQKFTPRLKPGYGVGQADIDYEVFFVTPDGSKAAKAEDSDWQKVGRLNKLYQHHKGMVNSIRKKLQNHDMLALSSQMNNMYAGMLKGIAIDATAQGAMQRAISGK